MARNVFIATLLVLAVLFLIANLQQPDERRDWTPEERAESQAYLDKVLIPSLMEAGIFTSFKDGAVQSYYVNGLTWRGLQYTSKQELLRKIQAANAISGRTPYVTFRDDRSGKILAEFGEVKFEVYE